MAPALAAAPLVAVVLAILLLRRPPLQAAALGALVAFAVAAWWREAASAFPEVISATLILSASAASVIVPGLLFIEASHRHGAAQALGDWVTRLPGRDAYKAALLVVGLATCVEGLTGFGVSLLVVVPAALSLLPRSVGLKVALLSMNVMPWGTLGLATVVGAQIAGTSSDLLGKYTALTSAPVFPLAAGVAAGLAAPRQPVMILAAIAIGVLFSVCLWAGNILLGPSVAGVTAGLFTLLAGLFALRAAGYILVLPPLAAWPFGLLFTAALVQRGLIAAWPGLAEVSMTGGSTSWAPLTSPGIALILAALITTSTRTIPAETARAINRAFKPVFALFLFVLMAQLMSASGMVSDLTVLARAAPDWLALASSAVLGLVSGYVTGSNVGGNALMMAPAAVLGESLGSPLLFAAVQNSAAGHAILASVPIVALLTGLANASEREQSDLLRFGMTIALANAALITIASQVLVTVF